MTMTMTMNDHHQTTRRGEHVDNREGERRTVGGGQVGGIESKEAGHVGARRVPAHPQLHRGALCCLLLVLPQPTTRTTRGEAILQAVVRVGRASKEEVVVAGGWWWLMGTIGGLARCRVRGRGRRAWAGVCEG
jgi:hypothetical protein